MQEGSQFDSHAPLTGGPQSRVPTPHSARRRSLSVLASARVQAPTIGIPCRSTVRLLRDGVLYATATAPYAVSASPACTSAPRRAISVCHASAAPVVLLRLRCKSVRGRVGHVPRLATEQLREHVCGGHRFSVTTSDRTVRSSKHSVQRVRYRLTAEAGRRSSAGPRRCEARPAECAR